MEQAKRQALDYLNKLRKQDSTEKSQTGDRNRNLEMSKRLAQQGENLQDKATTAAVPSKDTPDDPYGVFDSLAQHNLLPEKVKKQLDKKAQVTRAYGEAKDLMWQAERVIKRCFDTTHDSKMLELMKSFIKALDAFKKIERYKDKNILYLSACNIEEPIHTLKEALEVIKKSELVPKLPAGVSRKEDGSYAIDLSAFEPTDLAKLDLSRLGKFTFDVSDKKNAKYSYPFPVESAWRLENLDTIQQTLTVGCNLLEAHVYSQEDVALYKDVSKFYATFQLYCMLDKTDLSSPLKFADWWREGGEKVTSLMDRNKRLLISFEDTLDINSSKVVDKSQEMQDDNSTSRFLFSDKEIERVLADEMIVSHAYHDLWNKLQQPDTEQFKTDYAQVQAIVEMRIEDVKPEDREGFLATMREVNQGLKKTAEALARMMPKGDHDSAKDDIKEEDLNPLQLSLRYAIRETRRANEWASKEWPHNTKWFDLNDDWIGMEQRGIKRDKIEEACIKHQENEEVSKIINDQRESAKAAYSYSPSEAINIYEKLKRANAPLKYLSERLEAGIPAKGKPTRINGRDIIGTSGDDNNCLIHSLMEVSKPKELMDLEEKMKKGGSLEEQRKKVIKEMAKSIRKKLVEGGLANSGDFLDLDSRAGKQVIEELTKREWFEPSRGLLVYQLDSTRMRMQCHEVLPRTDENPDKPCYALFLSGEMHFEAMSEPKKE